MNYEYLIIVVLRLHQMIDQIARLNDISITLSANKECYSTVPPYLEAGYADCYKTKGAVMM